MAAMGGTTMLDKVFDLHVSGGCNRVEYPYKVKAVQRSLKTSKGSDRLWNIKLEKDQSRETASSVSLYCQPIVVSSTEPKWKQKLAAADAHAEATRQLTAQAQEEYRRKQSSIRQQQAGEGSAIPLNDLQYVPYLTEDGKFTDCTQAGAKATVYAIFDDDKVLQYIGISRQILQSMRLHFARMPRQCGFVKLQHINRPSRAMLEAVRDSWIAENGGPVPGNDNGALQNQWENPLDCKPLMTDAEREAWENAAPGPPKGKALKQVARRIENDLEEGFLARNCTENLRFDPKLKEQGLLDLKNPVPDTSVPTEKPKSSVTV